MPVPSQRTVSGLPKVLLPAAQTPEAGAAATPSSCPPTLNDPAGPATALPGRAAGTAQGDVTAGIPAAPGPAGAPVPAGPQETTAHAAAANATQATGTRVCKIPRRPRDMPLIPVSSTAPRPRLTTITHHHPGGTPAGQHRVRGSKQSATVPVRPTGAVRERDPALLRSGAREPLTTGGHHPCPAAAPPPGHPVHGPGGDRPPGRDDRAGPVRMRTQIIHWDVARPTTPIGRAWRQIGGSRAVAAASGYDAAR